MRWLDDFQDVKWDGDEATGVEMDRFQVTQLRHSACEITWMGWPVGAESPVEYSGQGGLVRGPDGKVKFLTVNHNICSEANRSGGVWEETQWGHRCLTVNGRGDRVLYIPRTGWERPREWTNRNAYSLGNEKVRQDKEMKWKYGVDISLGPELSDDGTSASTDFDEQASRERDRT